MTSQLEETAQKLYSRLDETSATMSDELEQTAARITGHITATTGNVAGKVLTITSTLSSQLEQSSKAIGATLDRTTTDLNALFTANTRMMTEQLDSTAGDVTNAFAATADRVTRQVTDATAAMAERLEQTSADVTQQLDTAGSSMFARIDHTARDLGTRMERTSSTITAQLEQAGVSMFSKIDQTARDLGNRFEMATGLLERVSGEATGKFAGSSARFADIVNTASSQIFGDLDKAAETFAAGLGTTSLGITGKLDTTTGLLVSRIDRAAKDLEQASQHTTGKLDEAHRKFSKHVETANTYLADQLSAAAGAIDERLEGISMNLTGKLEVTGSRVSERLDDVTELVERSLEKFNGEMERVLANRRDALDSLVQDAAKRANEIAAVMTSYMNLIEDSLSASETRSKEMSRIIADQTAQAMALLDSELRKLETNSGGQITQASRILRDQHERAMSSMNEMLASTATDFQQTAQEMRHTAQQVVKDIDVARGELKRSILELPEETRSNADAMRRVVADQISALNALAEVVRRQSGTLDMTGPGISLQRSLRESPPGKSEGATVQAPHNGTVSAQQTASQRSADAAKAEATEALRDRLLAELAHSSSRIEEKAKPASRPTLSREMESLADKLNVAARDLVEALEGALPRDLEKAYAAGDRSAFTHRLYDGRKKLAKQVAERYGKERLVRGRADAYVRLFERLLDALSATPGGDAMVDASLASEQGRLYVLLGEGTGRIPPQ